MQRVSVTLTKIEVAQLGVLAVQLGRNRSEMVREAVEQFIAKQTGARRGSAAGSGGQHALVAS
jgi:metal-responsive CopG/Arc/MetJ family transcriptional regulator